MDHNLRARCRFLNRIHTAIRKNEKGVPQETLVQSTPISQGHPSHNIQVGLSCQEDAILGPTTPFASIYAMWGRTKPADRPEWKALQSTHLTITRQGLMTSFERHRRSQRAPPLRHAPVPHGARIVPADRPPPATTDSTQDPGASTTTVAPVGCTRPRPR